MKILANDGIPQSGIGALETAGFEVITTKVAQIQLENYINKHQIDTLIVRNTTQVRQELMDNCPSLKLIDVASVDTDNIDVEYAIDQGLHLVSTPIAISNAVAELVFAHLFGMVRFLHQSNREMPLEGDLRFNELKRAFSAGTELRGKTLGIIGFDPIGQAAANLAIGLGMKVLVYNFNVETISITLEFFDGQKVHFHLQPSEFEKVLKQSDFISVHGTLQDSYLLVEKEINKMKKSIEIVNTANGKVLDEVALINAIETEKVMYAGLDVYENEPQPEIQLLMNPELSLTPHIGSATVEAQTKIGIELANQIIQLLHV